MKSIYITLLVPAISALLSGCQEEIDIELEDGQQKNVIEANCSALEHNATVLLSKTSSYFGGDEMETIDSATVTITMPDSTTVSLPMISSGVYSLAIPFTATGQTYKLEVNINGTTYEASSQLPAKVELDSVVLEEATGILASTDEDDERINYIINAYFKDLPGANYYRLVAYKLNDGTFTRIDDDTFDDTYFNQTDEIEIQLSDKLEAGQPIIVELISLDAAAYEYFLTLAVTNSAAGGSFSVPENPKSNISNDVLGYFSVYTSDTICTSAPFTTANIGTY